MKLASGRECRVQRMSKRSDPNDLGTVSGQGRKRLCAIFASFQARGNARTIDARNGYRLAADCVVLA